MSKFRFLFALLCGTCAAQSIYLSTPTSFPYIGMTQTETATVTGVSNKTVTWSTDHGTLVGTNPCVVNEPCTIGLLDTTARADTLTATSNANGSVTASATITFQASPTPITTFPRAFYTAANLSSLQSKYATEIAASNPQATGLQLQGINWFNQDNATTAWGRTGSTGWSCLGGNGQPATAQTSTFQEFAMYYFAQMAMLDPSNSTYNWKCYAHDVALYVFSQFPVAYSGLNYDYKDAIQLWIAGDWMRGLPGLTLTSGELATIRQGYSWLVLTAFGVPGGSGAYADPTAAFNSPAMFHGFVSQGTVVPTGNGDLDAARSKSGNNYNTARSLAVAFAGMFVNNNSTDDPLIATGTYNTCGAPRGSMCLDGSAGSLSAYLTYLEGAILYNYWAHIDDPAVVTSAYAIAFGNVGPSVPTCEWFDGNFYPCFGEGRGGGSSEGEYYQYSELFPRWILNMLHSAGLDDPLVNCGTSGGCPQMSAAFSSWWDLKLQHDLNFITFPTTANFGLNVQAAYTFETVGDILTINRRLSDMQTEAALMDFDTMTGRTDRMNALLWTNMNMSNGGPLGTSYGCANYCGYDLVLSTYPAILGISAQPDLFISLPTGDPVSSLPTDPRPSLPTDFYDGSWLQETTSRTGWGSTSSTVYVWMNNSGINHEYNWDGRYDVFSCLSGTCDDVTIGRDIFNQNYNLVQVGGFYQNELGIINSTLAFPQYGFAIINSEGAGQWPQGAAASFITSQHSELPTYIAVVGNTTNAYNGTPVTSYYATATDVNSASSDRVWIKGTNQIATYDRASVGHAASLQTSNLTVTGTPTIVGTAASWTLPSATQKAYLTNLLPASATMTAGTIFATIAITGPHSSLQQSTTMQLAVSGNNGGGPTSGLENSPFSYWYSSNSGIATVSATGLVTGVDLGTTQINLTYMGCYQLAVNVTVVSGASSGSISLTQTDTTQTWDIFPVAVLQVKPPSTPLASQFLNVLEWGASGFSKASTTLVQSTSGQAFDGALIGSNLVMFMRAWPTTFTSVTYPASGATTHYISDLTPNTSYAISGAGAPTSATTDTAGVLTFSATGTGNITVGAGSSSGGATFGGNVIISGGVVIQ